MTEVNDIQSERGHGKSSEVEHSSASEIFRIVIHALILALAIRVFLFQPFNIPSGSMKSTLLIGDYLFVSKYSYGYSKYSLPFSPSLFKGRIFSGAPKRGDVAVFRLPRDPDVDYIKRVIGLPGDKIKMVGGVLHVNNAAIPKKRVTDFVQKDNFGNAHRIPRFEETLPNGITYTVLDQHRYGHLDNTREYTVPKGHYFMMGDNRDNSTDSRVVDGPFRVGFVPLENFIGRAEVIFFSSSGNSSLKDTLMLPFNARWGRVFSKIK